MRVQKPQFLARILVAESKPLALEARRKETTRGSGRPLPQCFRPSLITRDNSRTPRTATDCLPFVSQTERRRRQGFRERQTRFPLQPGRYCPCRTRVRIPEGYRKRVESPIGWCCRLGPRELALSFGGITVRVRAGVTKVLASNPRTRRSSSYGIPHQPPESQSSVHSTSAQLAAAGRGSIYRR